jgi:uncharacterized protein
MEKQDSIEAVRRFVEKESYKPESHYGSEPYEFHFVPMHALAKTLAEKLEADVEIVEIAAWLHDIGSIMYGRKDHHLTGAKVSDQVLSNLEYPLERREQVKHCILAHRGSNGIQPQTLEAQIIIDADTLCNFYNISGLFKAALVYEGLSQGEAQISVREKLERKWKKLQFPESRELIKDNFTAAMLLLRD